MTDPPSSGSANAESAPGSDPERSRPASDPGAGPPAESRPGSRANPHPESRADAGPERDASRIDPATAEGHGRLLLFGGTGALAVGSLADAAPVVWAGVVAVGAAFALNTAGKVVHYRALSIPARGRLLLSASWAVLALTVVGLATTVAYALYGPGDGRFVWSLAVAGVGFGLLHAAAQSLYLPRGTADPEGDGESERDAESGDDADSDAHTTSVVE